MALPLLVLAVAVVLLLLLAALTALVKLVFWFTLRNTLLAVAVAAVYCVVAARRRCIAKGFYSCSQVPCTRTATAMAVADDEAATAQTTAVTDQLAVTSEAAAHNTPTPTPATATPFAANASSESDTVASSDGVTPASTTLDASPSAPLPSVVRRASLQLPSLLPVKTLSRDSVDTQSLSSTESEDDDELTLSLGRSTSSSRSPSPAAVAPAPVAATTAAARTIRPRSSSSSSGFSVANRRRLAGNSTGSNSSNRSPQAPRSAARAPPQSYQHTPPRSGGATRSRSRAATVTTSIGGHHSALLPRTAHTRRSGASERELMQEKMAVDGYWIGDFRPERVARRSFLGNGSSSAQSSPRAV